MDTFGNAFVQQRLAEQSMPWMLVLQSEELELQYKSCYARILDSKRRFLEAATRYYELSQIGKKVIGGRLVSACTKSNF